jgi:hypothetical protein
MCASVHPVKDLIMPHFIMKNALLIALFCYREEVYVIEGGNDATLIDNVIVIDDVTVIDDVILESAEDSGSHVELIPLDTGSDFIH